MLRRPWAGLLLGVGMVIGGQSAAGGTTPDRRCSPTGGIPKDGYDPVPLVASAQVILRARADSLTAMPTGRRVGPSSWVHFTVLEVIDSRGMAIPTSLRMVGSLSDQPDFNPSPLPYRWVRPDGLRGACNAYTYQRGGEFLLLLKGSTVDSLHPYWSGLTPTNEQVTGRDDPWVQWVRGVRRAGPT